MHTEFLHSFQNSSVSFDVDVVARVLHIHGRPPSLLLSAQQVSGGLTLLNRVTLRLPVTERLLDADNSLCVLALKQLLEMEELGIGVSTRKAEERASAGANYVLFRGGE